MVIQQQVPSIGMYKGLEIEQISKGVWNLNSLGCPRVGKCGVFSSLKYEMAYSKKIPEILPISTLSLHGNLATGSYSICMCKELKIEQI